MCTSYHKNTLLVCVISEFKLEPCTMYINRTLATQSSYLFNGYSKDGNHSWMYFFNGYSDWGYCMTATTERVV